MKIFTNAQIFILYFLLLIQREPGTLAVNPKKDLLQCNITRMAL